MLSDFLTAVLALAASPLLLWLAVVALLVLAGGAAISAQPRTLPSSDHRPDEPYDWQEHGL